VNIQLDVARIVDQMLVAEVEPGEYSVNIQ
jgi:hypothetical protein